MTPSERSNAASRAAILAIGQYIDPRDTTETLIVAESFVMGMMLLVAPNDLRAQLVYLDSLTEAAAERLTRASQ